MTWIVVISIAAVLAAPVLVAIRRRQPPQTFVYSLEQGRWVLVKKDRLER